MRFQLFVVTAALGIAGLAASFMKGGGAASEVAGYATWALIPVYWFLRKYLRNRHQRY